MYYRVGTEKHLRNYLKALRQAQPFKMSSEKLLAILAILNTDLMFRFKGE